MQRLLRLAALVFGWGLLAAAALAQSDGYRLAENDELRLIAPESPGVAGTYRLGEGGRIALPVSRTVLLGGMTLDQAEEEIRLALESGIVAPVIGVELASRRPFYITGDVANPGAYPGVSGLTLDRAVALAGGDRRKVESDRLVLATTQIRSREELDRALRERSEAEIRLARLQADLAGAAEFAVPGGLSLSADQASASVAREAAILSAGVAAYSERLASIARLLAARTDEIAALKGRLETSASQTDQITKEIADARDLVNRGLAPISRLNGLLREADRQQSETLQIRVLLNQALQAVAQLELEQANAPRERTIDLSNQIAETSARIATLSLSISASAALIDETGAPPPTTPGAVRVTYRVQHADGSSTADTEDGSLPVLPGDLVTVIRRTGTTGVGQ